MNAVRTTLTRDHRELDGLLQAISDDATAPASGIPLQSTWSEFENRLSSHMAAEESELLPLVAAGHPLEAARMRSEHDQIRQLVSGLGVAIDLHAARQPAIEALVRLLRNHARREDRVLYEFAGRDASSAVHFNISSALRAAGRAIVARTAVHSSASGK